jgi:predicted Rossmann fold nucleotide-binding protein DprA/Smf involved in DNA uptake
MAMAKSLPSYKTYDFGNEKQVDDKKKTVKKTPYKLKEQAPPQAKNTEKIEINKKILTQPLSKNTKMIYNQLDKQIFSCDDLLSSEVNSGMALAAVGELELYGLIEAIPGGRYKLL